MSTRRAPDDLAGYPPALVQQVTAAIDQGRLADALRRRYPDAHAVRSDSALYDYVQAIKAEHMRSAPPLGKVRFDNTLQVIRNALGTHTAISRVQGARLQAKREIHIETEDLRVLPDVEFAETALPVAISTPESLTRGVGMRAYLDENRVQLLSRVKTTIEPLQR